LEQASSETKVITGDNDSFPCVKYKSPRARSKFVVDLGSNGTTNMKKKTVILKAASFFVVPDASVDRDRDAHH
jgi:hypothetical protein